MSPKKQEPKPPHTVHPQKKDWTGRVLPKPTLEQYDRMMR